MRFKVTILFPGFSGALPFCSLGWGTWALIQDGTHNIMLDTGNVGLRQNYANILASQGVSCADIDIVLLTHLHFDHACNVDLFHNATFVLAEKEWEYANTMQPRDLFIQESAIVSLRNSRLHFVRQDDEEIIPGITTLMTPGHTPGSISFVLHQENGQKWILAGDAAKNRGELMTGEVQMTLDPVATTESLQKILKISNRVLPGHDGWVTVKNEQIIPESGNDATILFGQGVTVNGGLNRITIHMD